MNTCDVSILLISCSTLVVNYFTKNVWQSNRKRRKKSETFIAVGTFLRSESFTWRALDVHVWFGGLLV